MAKRLSDHPTLEELNDFFGHDRFAEHAGCRIVEGSRDHAVCELDIKDHHRNALGNVMGGAIFTLADFALAIASNTGENPSVSVSSTIEYLSASKGTCLVATCDADKSGRRLGFYTTDITDDTGRRIARVAATVFRESDAIRDSKRAPTGALFNYERGSLAGRSVGADLGQPFRAEWHSRVERGDQGRPLRKGWPARTV